MELAVFHLVSQYDAQREGCTLEVRDHRSHPCIRLPCRGIASTYRLPEDFLMCS